MTPEYQRIRRAKLVAEGRCVSCLKNYPEDGYRTCRPCIDKVNQKDSIVSLKIDKDLAHKAWAKVNYQGSITDAVESVLREQLK